MNQTKVYVIDDEPELVALLTEVVDLIGVSSKGYTRAKDFFAEVTTVQVQSILVLDLQMPEMDGIEVMRRLAKMRNPPALILISGHDMGVLHSAEKLGKAHNLEILASLCKPVPVNEFQVLIENFTQKYHALKSTKNRSQEYEFSAEELSQAIEQGQLALYYQPQVNVSTGSLYGVEALVRWQHPVQGLVFPNEFIPLAESSGLMGDLTRWVINEAILQEQIWKKEGYNIVVSVNISADDIKSLTLPEQLSDFIEKNKSDPTRLTLEITESALMGELVTSLDILTRLRLKGLGLSIDDFGTGYSSLSQLHRIPFSELKIDQSFVSGMSEDKEASSIVKTCIILGHELNMQVVAEGVETEAQWKKLKQYGCDLAQGYFFSRPIPVQEMTDYLAKLQPQSIEED